eukprot:CAMPEP_0174832046 /NCGR_PEP_ID=MMETSP1114-20130205/3457_1 /TAXON_ID=312471 /ORGANISM="Neobodo designis, Strain CCAP 1951/1" /LENGTH=57 /DNA_ID=CAMNT_0016065897 /DNA_START=33 /DNA_END=203 /DNA_ORIENTATION=+
MGNTCSSATPSRRPRTLNNNARGFTDSEPTTGGSNPLTAPTPTNDADVPRVHLDPAL